MSLFARLPPPANKNSKRNNDDEDGEEKLQRAPKPETGEQGGGKRQRVASAEPGGEAAAEPGGDAAGVAGGPLPPPAAVDVCAALTKIAAHIGTAAKFPKASALLRQLLDSPSLGREHKPQVLEALAAAFRRPQNALEPHCRREYGKLVAEAQARPDLFGREERPTLEVYALWAILQNELHTDDSFLFSKAVNKIKEAVDALPEQATDADEAALAALLAAGMAAAAAPSLLPWLQQPAERPGRGGYGEPAAASNSDAGAADGATEAVAPIAAPASGALSAPAAGASCGPVWQGEQAAVMRRRALLDCMATAMSYHKKPWARITVELLVEHMDKNAARFCAPQREEVRQAMVWVRQQRVARAQGRDAAGGKAPPDATSFEKARAEWSRATVSARGNVSGGGDPTPNSWLG